MIKTLGNVALFAGLNPDELASLAAMATLRSYPSNAVIINEGDRADTLFLILSGRIKVFVADGEGREVTLRTQGPGEYFGEMMLDDGLRSASVITVEPCRLAAISRDAFRDFIGRHPEAALALIKNLILRTRSLTDQVRDLALLDVYGRVAKLLLTLARDVDGRLVIEERLTQQEIGERVGASREMVSRILKDLKTGNYVRIEDGRMIILRRPPSAW